MRVRKVNSEGVKIHDSVQEKLKTAGKKKTTGNTSVVQFTAGYNKSCPVRNLSRIIAKVCQIRQEWRTKFWICT